MPDKNMYILTRYNVALHKHPDRFNYDEYMRKRTNWFKLMTVPSVKNQTCKNFKWLVLIDKETPNIWKDELGEILSGVGCLVEIDSENISDAVGDSSQSQIGIQAMERFGYKPKDLIITSRLDNDDCIARHYVWRVRRSLNKHNDAVQFRQGYYWYHASKMKGRFYKSEYPKNMFPSVIEEGDKLKTVFCIDHPRLNRRFNVEYQNGGEMWLYNWLPDGLNLQNFTSRFAKRSGYPRCQGAVIAEMKKAHIERVFGINIDKITQNGDTNERAMGNM